MYSKRKTPVVIIVVVNDDVVVIVVVVVVKLLSQLKLILFKCIKCLALSVKSHLERN